MTGTVTDAMNRTLSALAAGAAVLLALAGCAVAPTAASTPAAVVETEVPATEVAVGNTLTAEQATALNEGNDLMKAYPVGDQFYAVQWGHPVPDAVKAEVQARMLASSATWGTGTNADANDADWNAVHNVMKQESEKLGGISIAVVSCAMSFSTITNAYEPTWVISEPGPVGQYESKEAAFERADGWAQEGKKMYAVINNLGC